MVPLRGHVVIRPHPRPDTPTPAADYVVPFLPEGCPAALPGWPLADGVYDGPHRATACPECLPTRRRTAYIGDPYYLTRAPDQPLIYLLGSTPTHGVNPSLATVLDETGFTCAGWLPLPGLDDTFVFDHPTDHTRVILHSAGVEFHLRHPGTGQRFHAHLGRRFDPVQPRVLLAEGGYRPDEDTDSTPPARSVHPAPPPDGRPLTPGEAAHLITTGDHTGAMRGSLVLDAVLLEALHAGWITAVQMPDGSLAFTLANPC
ncbi:hypothetical protein [Parafrankia elaeagni]|uniref:hypothetical protein n=1 Tax=Parafrankia elaeagni TaxID=222534 RepID=UPI000378CE84|nr:hypothetical protein [Parafrankia elaeagni]